MVTTQEVRGVALALLARRAAGATACPSEIARALTAAGSFPSADWRDAMPTVHAAIDELAAAGVLQLSWKGKGLPKRAGPYRIGQLARA